MAEPFQVKDLFHKLPRLMVIHGGYISLIKGRQTSMGPGASRHCVATVVAAWVGAPKGS